MNIERKSPDLQGQSLFLRDRKDLEIRGVKDVVRFDEETAVFSVSGGTLTVEGSDLHVQALDPDEGRVVLDGKVDALLYFDSNSSEKNGKPGLFGRLFH